MVVAIAVDRAAVAGVLARLERHFAGCRPGYERVGLAASGHGPDSVAFYLFLADQRWFRAHVGALVCANVSGDADFL